MNSLISSRKWSLSHPNQDVVERVQNQLNCSKPFARLLASRFGEEYPLVFRDSSSSLHDPHKLKGLSQAVDRIQDALDKGERIFIHGDFDVDGLCSAAILYLTLTEIACREEVSVKVELGDRGSGHGLDPSNSARIIDEDFQLLITTDCGVKATKEIEHLQKHGVDVIVTDHHTPGNDLPPATAIVNPKRSDSTYPNRNLAGSGVSYKLASALKNSSPDKPGTDGALIQLAALGTVGDMVPLISGSEDENRRMVQMGLTALNRSPTVGLDALIERLGLKKKALTARTISFQIAPKLNAANRVGDPKVGFLLLTTRQAARAKYLAEVLVDYNEDRSDLQQRTTKEAKQKLEDRKITPQEEGVVFIKDEEWNPGIIGLTASKLANQYSLPACVLTRDGPRYKGSVRSVQGLNIIKGLTRCSDYLTRFGGHEMAGGFQLEPHQVGQFRECIGQWSSQILKDREKSEPQAAKKQIDAIINPHEIEERLLDEVNQLRPFGPGNPPPIFLLEEAPVSNLRKVGKRKNHLKMDLELETETFDCIGFNMAGALEQIKERERYNLVFQLEEDSWNDTCLQLKLEDLVL